MCKGQLNRQVIDLSRVSSLQIEVNVATVSTVNLIAVLGISTSFQLLKKNLSLFTMTICKLNYQLNKATSDYCIKRFFKQNLLRYLIIGNSIF